MGAGARWGAQLRPIGLGLAVVLAAGTGDAAPIAARSPRTVARVAPRSMHAASPIEASAKASWASALAPIEVVNRNTNARASIRLYAESGVVERSELRSFLRVACSHANATDADADVGEPLDPRLVQLAIRAAYHFGGKRLVIVSATRKGAHGRHGSGEALDFKLDGVPASSLAAYARTFPRAGVGIYTHPRTQYIHLDVRDRSYHWLDGSPPGVTWRERLLRDGGQAKRDASWAPVMDLPEAATL